MWRPTCGVHQRPPVGVAEPSVPTATVPPVTRPEPLPDQWHSRDFPVLTEAARLIDERGLIGANSVELAHALGMTRELVERSVCALERTGWITRADWDSEGVDVRDVSARAYLVTGLHPDGDDAISRLISAFEKAIEQTSDEGQRSRLRRLAESLKDAPREIVGSVISAAIGAGLGLG
jgi:hypothetical protein